MKLRGVVLDMDGTITRFNLDFREARRVALAELEKLNLRTADMTEQLSIYLILKQLRGRLDIETYENLRKRFYNLLEDMEIKAAQQVMLYPGALDTLRKLQERCLRIGLVTNNGQKGTDLTLKRFGLKLFFDAIVTRDDCEEMKPDPAPLRKALTELKIGADEAIFVGDGLMDMIAAKQAGLTSVAVPTGPFSVERMLQSEPDYLLASVNDLPDLIVLF